VREPLHPWRCIMGKRLGRSNPGRLMFSKRNSILQCFLKSLPMMHRHGWQGPRAPSNTCFAWFVWDARSNEKRVIDWFDWKLIVSMRDDLFGGRNETPRAVA